MQTTMNFLFWTTMVTGAVYLVLLVSVVRSWRKR